MRWIATLLIACFAWPAAAADEVVIRAGEQAVIEFRFDEPPLAANGEPVNFLSLSVGGSYVDFIGESRLVHTLHDGLTPLAVREVGRGGGLAALFVDDNNPLNGVTMDFSSVQDGSIQGRLVIRPDFDTVSTQARIRFAGQLISGRITDDEPSSPGPNAQIIGCHIEAPIFQDRFASPVPAAQAHADHRECGLGG